MAQYTSGSAFSIGKMKRPEMVTSKMAKIVPGPGTHEITSTIRQKSEPKWVFGSSKRPGLQNSNSTDQLGPGSYPIQSKMVENQQYSMGLINHNLKVIKQRAPGPGAYNPEPKKIQASHSYSMGAITVNKTLQANKIKDLPGPGNYNPSVAYDSQYKYNGHAKIGTSLRQGIYNEKLSKFGPSPFQYKQDKFAVQKSAPKFSFGSSIQRPKTSNSITSLPGPGTYRIAQLVGNETQGKSLAQKLCPEFEKPGSQKTPGPGTYQDMYKNSKKIEPSWRIGTEKRNQKEDSAQKAKQFPALNAYNPQYVQTMNQSARYGFGTEKRQNLSQGKNEKRPTMQSYNIPSKIGEGQNWQMGLKLQNHGSLSVKNLNPGPGNYDPLYGQNQTVNPSFSIKGRYNAAKKLNVPGPGTYKASLTDKKKPPGFVFGSSAQRIPLKETKAPGPGQYNIPCSIAEMPGYAMQGQSQEFKYI